MKRLITRDEIAEMLKGWAAGRISSEDIHSWANGLFLSDDVEFSDWERDEDSVANEVLGALDMLDMNLVVPSDAGILLDFLGTPAGEFHAGYQEMKRRFDAIDYDARKKQLRHHPLYAPFLRSSLR